MGRRPGDGQRGSGLTVGATVAPERVTPILPRQEEDKVNSGYGEGCIVIVYDNDYNTIPEVILILQKATGCTLEEASIETWEIHTLGKSVVHHGSWEECERAAEIIRTIGIRVEVVEE
ncbi:MAG TPA: ATP-dependent Clp protease adaptor ClpS [Chthonomonadaceae bacterium]|nr:ATP-dependent Clp protease adaptor ClpS [Chthonomonadaceae bacterium]